jgi:D-alanyl-D-alanine dipeptidase/GNAT superfamily N-acetyltransferase
MIEIQKLSTVYTIRRMNDSDADEILHLCLENTQYYEYCGKQPSKELILSDLHITPPGTGESDKYYIGFFDAETLIAVMDLIDGYQEKETAFIGFFMMKKDRQGRNAGSAIINETAEYLRRTGKKKIMLGIDQENPQSRHFWKKNGFQVIREAKRGEGIILVAAKELEQTPNFSEDSSDFVVLGDVIPEALMEIRYYTDYNFTGERIDGYEEPAALLTKQAAAALQAVSDDCAGRGLRLKIYDAYRPQRAVDHFVRWAKDVNDVRMKEIFYPEVNKAELFEKGYIASHSSHTRGSTVDLTLAEAATGEELDMGGTFDYFGERSHPDFPGISEQQRQNRNLLRDLMVRHGFAPIAEEWWHFTLEQEPYPDTYFTFPVSRGSLKREEEERSDSPCPEP